MAFSATEKVAVRSNDQLDQPRSGPVYTEKAAEDRLEML